jgi:hypothetical protein
VSIAQDGLHPALVENLFCFAQVGKLWTSFAMSFTFGFNGDDIEEDEKNHQEQDDALVGQISDYTISDQDPEDKHAATLPPQRHSLAELVGSTFLALAGLVLYPVAAVQGVAEEFDTQAPFCIWYQQPTSTPLCQFGEISAVVLALLLTKSLSF